ncbi:START domain-containing protein [Nibrella viscosa]|uniref:START domain-containing protein n=1 Tax=Nibrella viscosa TaxID=1084524 RepID=A0ABP8KF86_9BACT
MLSRIACGQSGEEWRLEKDKNGIKVYSRHLEGAKLKEIRVVCEVEGTLSQLVAYLSDIENFKHVVYRTKESYPIRWERDNEVVYYNESDSPWPVANRDLVMRMTFQQHPVTKVLRIEARNVPDGLPPKPGIVRIPFWHSVWTVRQVDSRHIHIDYFFKVDPGGEIPPWLTNMVAAVGPYHSFHSLQKSLGLPRYQNKTFSFLQP